jgi:hypothetical protein
MEQQAISSKRCTDCKKSKRLDSFHKHRNKCIECYNSKRRVSNAARNGKSIQHTNFQKLEKCTDPDEFHELVEKIHRDIEVVRIRVYNAPVTEFEIDDRGMTCSTVERALALYLSQNLSCCVKKYRVRERKHYHSLVRTIYVNIDPDVGFTLHHRDVFVNALRGDATEHIKKFRSVSIDFADENYTSTIKKIVVSYMCDEYVEFEADSVFICVKKHTTIIKWSATHAIFESEIQLLKSHVESVLEDVILAE